MQEQNVPEVPHVEKGKALFISAVPDEAEREERKKILDEFERRIEAFEVRPDDIWMPVIPKCGSTWSQEMIWIIGNDVNIEKAYSILQEKRFPVLESSSLKNFSENPDSIEYVDTLPKNSSRFIKTHFNENKLPTQLWTKKPKIFYIYRDPRDAAISLYHNSLIFTNYSGTLEEFLDAFLQDKVAYGPFWTHVLKFWNIRNEENVIFFTYDDMKQDLEGVVNKTAQFMGKTLTKEDIAKILEYLDIRNMKKNMMVNNEHLMKAGRKGEEHNTFIRKGESGGWKKILSPEYIAKFDNWSHKYLQGTDFPYYTYATGITSA